MVDAMCYITGVKVIAGFRLRIIAVGVYAENGNTPTRTLIVESDPGLQLPNWTPRNTATALFTTENQRQFKRAQGCFYRPEVVPKAGRTAASSTISK
jgi:hypothetical protein